MSHVSVIEFAKQVGPYRTGERAGFEAEQADAIVAAKLGRIVLRDVPKVDPGVVVSDAQRQLQELRNMLARAEREAQGAAKVPSASAAAAEALDLVAQLGKQMKSFEKQLAAASGMLPLPGSSRQPPASDAA